MNEFVDTLIEACAVPLAREPLAFGHGSVNPRSEAELLVMGFLENHPLDENTRGALRDLLQRRIAERIPSAYLTGEAWFADHWFAVQPGVMIPRSPMQELIRCDFRPWLRRKPETVLDICCGTGCLGIATALRFADARITLADVDEAAVANARTNIERFALADRVEARRSDLFDGLDRQEFGAARRCRRAAVANARTNIERFALADRVEARRSDLFDGLDRQEFDLVLANPPYVPQPEFLALPPEYAHEPRRGLEAGADGLDCWRRLMAEIGPWLGADGLLVGEAGNTAIALGAAFRDLPFVWPEIARAERLSDGGFGVFVLDAAALTCHPASDSRYFRGINISGVASTPCPATPLDKLLR